MRMGLKVLLITGVAALSWEAAPSLAADPGTTPAGATKVRVIKHKRVVHRVVRDYDGTPILLRRRPMVLRDHGGARVVLNTEETIPLQRPTPRYYFNGQPVRGWNF